LKLFGRMQSTAVAGIANEGKGLEGLSLL